MCLDSWRHFMPSSTRFQWRRIVYYGVCVSLFQNAYKNLYSGSCTGDYPGSSRMKLLAHSHLWWPGLDLDLEKLTKSCTACLSVKQATATASLHPWVWPPKPWQCVHIDFAGPILDRMFPLLVDAYSRWDDRYGQVYNSDVWFTRASSVRQQSTVHLWRVYEVSASQWGEVQPMFTIPSLIQWGLLNVLYALSNKLWRQGNLTDFQVDIKGKFAWWSQQGDNNPENRECTDDFTD